MKIKELILKLQQLDQEQDVHIYEGTAKEFTSDYGWECIDSDDEGIQIFFPSEELEPKPTYKLPSFFDSLKRTNQ